MSSNILASIGSARAPILVQLSEYEGRRTLDVRRYFKAAGSDELCPTKKGIAMNRETLLVLTNVLAAEQDRIRDWLDALPKDSSSVDSQLAQRRQALDDLVTGARPQHTTFENWKSPAFFEVAYDGHEDRLRFNNSHPVTAMLESARESRDPLVAELVATVETLLTSYARSKALFQGVDAVEADSLFGDLEFNWGLILERQLSGRAAP